MSITSSFYTGLSGLSTHGTAMGVIGDNISNINTTGYKSSSPAFEDILGQSLSGVQGSSQTGAGTNVQSIDVNYIQGTFETTEVPTDVAINGRGFFIVKDPSTNEQFYTRAGHYNFDNQGYYVNSEGKRVQGFLYDNAGTTLIESLANIQVNQNSMIAPQVTTTAEVILNLDSSAATLAWAIANPNGTSNFSSPVTIYDSLGQAHVVQVYFTNISTVANPRRWEWHAVIANSDTSAGGAGYSLFGQGVTVGTTLLEFNTSGVLTSPAATIPFHDQAANAITYANGVAATNSTIDFRGTTQYGSVSAVQRIDQNGYGPGSASAIAIDELGNLTANYTNGQVKKIARLAVANFPNINGLARQGGTLSSETVSSGQPLINKPGVGGMGSITSSMLEESNVDLAGEIIKMIIIQRGYEANSKVISTTDAMMNTLLNIR
jgi:flagellar hook protein FlgE